MATTTEDLAGEHQALTRSCGLLDRSERGKLALTGGEAKSFLAGQVTNDIEGLAAGTGCYAAFLTHKGKMLGDLRVLAVDDAGEAEPELQLDTERPTLQALFDMIRRFKIGYDVELHKRTVQRGLLSLIGPDARAVAGVPASLPADEHAHAPVASAPTSLPADEHAHAPGAGAPTSLPADEHAHAPGAVGGAPVRFVVTDGGVDVLCEAGDTEAVRAALVAGGAVAVSEAAVEIVRVERGRPRYGADVDETTIPQEAGLNERAVSFTKGCYVGQETVARLFYRGKPNRHLRGLRLTEPARSGAELHLGERLVGRIGSSVVSPTLGPIALALVRREAAIGDTLAVEGGARAEVVELPFA